MDRLLGKLYHRLTDNELDAVKDKFWTEYEEFINKTGRFGGARRYIWNSELLRKRHSAKWHAQYTVPFTEVSLLLYCLFCHCHIANHSIFFVMPQLQVHLSKEEKAARKAAREAEARKGGKGRKGTGKRKRDDSSDEDKSDSDREYF